MEHIKPPHGRRCQKHLDDPRSRGRCGACQRAAVTKYQTRLRHEAAQYRALVAAMESAV